MASARVLRTATPWGPFVANHTVDYSPATVANDSSGSTSPAHDSAIHRVKKIRSYLARPRSPWQRMGTSECISTNGFGISPSTMMGQTTLCLVFVSFSTRTSIVRYKLKLLLFTMAEAQGIAPVVVLAEEGEIAAPVIAPEAPAAPAANDEAPAAAADAAATGFPGLGDEDLPPHLRTGPAEAAVVINGLIDRLGHLERANAVQSTMMAVNSSENSSAGWLGELQYSDQAVAIRAKDNARLLNPVTSVIGNLKVALGVFPVRCPGLDDYDLGLLKSSLIKLESTERLLHLYIGGLEIAQSKGWATYNSYIQSLAPYAANPPQKWVGYDFRVIDSKQLKLASELGRPSPAKPRGGVQNSPRPRQHHGARRENKKPRFEDRYSSFCCHSSFTPASPCLAMLPAAQRLLATTRFSLPAHLRLHKYRRSHSHALRRPHCSQCAYGFCCC